MGFGAAPAVVGQWQGVDSAGQQPQPQHVQRNFGGGGGNGGGAGGGVEEQWRRWVEDPVLEQSNQQLSSRDVGGVLRDSQTGSEVTGLDEDVAVFLAAVRQNSTFTSSTAASSISGTGGVATHPTGSASSLGAVAGGGGGNSFRYGGQSPAGSHHQFGRSSSTRMNERHEIFVGGVDSGIDGRGFLGGSGGYSGSELSGGAANSGVGVGEYAPSVGGVYRSTA